MRCPACERENRDDARYCRGCGASLPSSCSGCGAPAEPDSDFCDLCGARLAATGPPSGGSAARAAGPASYTPRQLAERILSMRTALEGERKHVTVLFADLVDSSGIAGRLGADEMHALMDRCFARLLGEVHRYEGTVNQFTGDGIMAIFGAPVALEHAFAAELERRAGRGAQANRCEAKRAQVVGALAGSLPDAERRRGLLASAAAPII